ERTLDRVVAALGRGPISDRVNLGVACWRLARHWVDADQLQPAPITAEREPCLPVAIDDQVGVDRVEGAARERLDHHAMVRPAIGGRGAIERPARRKTDDRAPRTPGRDIVVEVKLPVEIANIWRPHAVRLRDRLVCPGWNALERIAVVGPLPQIA